MRKSISVPLFKKSLNDMKLHENHEELMHYTNALGLQGIVTSKVLWASHASFLNDPEEVVGFFSRVFPQILRPVVEHYFVNSEELSTFNQTAGGFGVNLVDYYLHKIVAGFREAERGGSGNSDSVISGSLASPKPPSGGDTKERGHETHETESRSDL